MGNTEGTICVYEDLLEKTDLGWRYGKRDVFAKTPFADLTTITASA